MAGGEGARLTVPFLSQFFTQQHYLPEQNMSLSGSKCFGSFADYLVVTLYTYYESVG